MRERLTTVAVMPREQRKFFRRRIAPNILIAFLGLIPCSARAQAGDPTAFFYRAVTGPDIVSDDSEFKWQMSCVDIESGLPLECLAEIKIEFAFPAIAQSPEARLLWGGGHLHTNNRPVGTLTSQLPNSDADGKRVYGVTGKQKREIKLKMPLMIPGEVTNHARYTVLDQPDPRNPSGPPLVWRALEGNGWHIDRSDTTGRSGKYNFAVFANFPVSLHAIPETAKLSHHYSPGQFPEHPSIYFGTPAADRGLQDLSTQYVQMYDFLHPIYNAKTVMLVDWISLPNGGYFDVDESWSDFLAGHSQGSSADISGVLTVQTPTPIPIEWEIMTQILDSPLPLVPDMRDFRLDDAIHLSHFNFR